MGIPWHPQGSTSSVKLILFRLLRLELHCIADLESNSLIPTTADAYNLEQTIQHKHAALPPQHLSPSEGTKT